MKKRLASLAIMLATTGVIGSLGVGSVYADTEETTATATETQQTTEETSDSDAEETVTITSVVYGDNYVQTAAQYTDADGVTSTDDTINSPSASSNIVSVTLSDGTVVTADTYGEGDNAVTGVLTLVVNGVEKDILDYVEDETALEKGTYSFVSTKGSVVYSEMAKFMNMAGQTAQYTYRQALKIVDGAIDADETITELLANTTYTADGISDGTIDIDGAFFNGIYVDGDSTFKISNLVMELDGDGANDFEGEAAAVLADGTSTVTIEDTYIHTAGVIRTAAAAKDSADLVITDSVIFAEEGSDTNSEYEALVVPMMKRTPFALGLEGTIRATNVLGAGQGIYSDSLIVSSGWGVLSTDSGSSYSSTGTYALDVTNVTAGIGEISIVQAPESDNAYDAVMTVNGVTYGYTYEEDYSGYVAYADSGVYDKFESVTFFSPDYIQIMASSTSSAFYTNSTLNCGRIAVMTQQNNGGTISITDSTVQTGLAVVQIKSGAANVGYTNVVLDNVDVNFTKSELDSSNILVELVESDDAGNPGNTTYTISDTGDEATVESSQGEIEDSNALLKNGDYTGNIYNSIYNYTEALNVTLENATLTGVVSSSVATHQDMEGNDIANGTVLSAYSYADYRNESTDAKIIGTFVHTANKVVNNPVNLTVDANSVWNVTGTSYLADLVLASDESISGSTTIYAQSLTVGDTVYADGTYTVNGVTIVVEAAETVEKADTGLVYSTSFYDTDATPANFYVVDEDGNYVSAAASVSGKAFSTIGFSVTVADGYELVSVNAQGGTVAEGNTDGYDYTLTKDEDATAVVVTITVRAVAEETTTDETVTEESTTVETTTDTQSTSASDTTTTVTASTTDTTTTQAAVGETLTKGKVTYTVTGDGEVEFTSTTSTAKKITVKQTVTIDGVTYKVTSIGSKAFKNTKATKVVVGANVSKICAKAFQKSKVKTVVLKTKKLTKASVKNALKSSKVTTIKVKLGTKKATANYVKKYKKLFTKKIAGKKVTIKAA